MLSRRFRTAVLLLSIPVFGTASACTSSKSAHVASGSGSVASLGQSSSASSTTSTAALPASSAPTGPTGTATPGNAAGKATGATQLRSSAAKAAQGNQPASTQVLSVFDSASGHAIVEPTTLGLDMHDEVTNIRWATAVPGSARATATLVNFESATNVVRRNIEFRVIHFAQIGGVYSAELAEAWAGSSPSGVLQEIGSWTLSTQGGLHWVAG
ncbi:MAG: hypothetical protein M3N95_14940 [Actinomycetota bacterium]|nr:hypothetical protein [Actinomycetota bacterium]